MTKRIQYKHGDWIVVCTVCGTRCWGSEAKKRWDGAVVCPTDWEPRPEGQKIVLNRESRSVPFVGQVDLDPNDSNESPPFTPSVSNPGWYS
jgi:hypothetical protein